MAVAACGRPGHQGEAGTQSALGPRDLLGLTRSTCVSPGSRVHVVESGGTTRLRSICKLAALDLAAHGTWTERARTC